MKYAGRANSAALKLIGFALIAGVIAGCIAKALGVLNPSVSAVLIILWSLFVGFTLYFFRDPNANVPNGPGLVVSPAHGKVDLIDQTTEPLFIGGPCQRISIFLSVVDIHVQNAPVSGKINFYRYTAGKFLNALKAESALHNENALIGIDCAERAGTRIGVRLIAGLIARRIVPFASDGEEITRGQRISLIQFGSRTDLYLPLSAKIKVKLGDHVVGGETIMAALE